MRLKAKIQVWNGGKHGRCGEYIAVIEPEFFKNGNIKKTDFKVVEVIEVIKKGYNFGTAKQVETIKEILK